VWEKKKGELRKGGAKFGVKRVLPWNERQGRGDPTPTVGTKKKRKEDKIVSTLWDIRTWVGHVWKLRKGQGKTWGGGKGEAEREFRRGEDNLTPERG